MNQHIRAANVVLTVYILESGIKKKKFQTDPFPESVGDILSTAQVEVLTAVVWNHVLMQGSEPVLVACYSTAVPLVYRQTFGYTDKQPFSFSVNIVYLSLYGVPSIPQTSIVVSLVQHQTFFQVLFGIFTHLEKDSQ